MEDGSTTNAVQPEQKRSKLTFIGITISALGVVFGDIGTSPLYAIRELFTEHHSIQMQPMNVLGAVSVVFWFLVMIVTVKYVLLMMQADNKGEGGIMSLMALVDRIGPDSKKIKLIVTFMGIAGAALLFSDGIITPAISVLSAVEGLALGKGGFSPYIVPFALIILVALFMLQSMGTSKIGGIFGPVLFLWFVIIAILGIRSIITEPHIFLALNPFYGFVLLATDPGRAVAIVATLFLSVTGAEVLYVDMGHYGRGPIRTAWFFIVFPGLLLNYMGQGAYLLHGGVSAQNLFFRLCPAWFVIPMVVIATASTVIASQAVISGAFSLARQAVQLGFWPRLRIVHTSAQTIGQIYIPFINFTLLAGTVLLIIIFKRSSNLAGAYGIAVSATMLITTILALLIARKVWKAPLWVIVILGSFFLLLHTFLFIANLTKLISGGWIVAIIAVSVSVMMIIWLNGRLRLRNRIQRESIPINSFIEDMERHKPVRVSGTAVFLSANIGAVPRTLLHNYKHNKIIHERTIIAAVQIQEEPHVKFEQRVSMRDLGSGLMQAILRFGFMETPNVPGVLKAAGILTNPMETTYFLGKESLALTRKSRIHPWARRLFMFMAKNSYDASLFYHLPPNRVIELGVQVEL